MTEWLLSGHNTQESITIAHPLIASAVEANMNTAVMWTIESLAGDTSDLAPIRPAALVQGWLYINIDYSTRNIARVLPLDPASVGVPVELIEGHKTKVPLGRMLLLPTRFRSLYRWTTDFYQHVLPAYYGDTREKYWTMHGQPDDDLTWSLFEPAFAERLVADARAHGVVSIAVAVLDTVIRQQAPELLEMFVGRATATSLIGQRIWDLRQVAERCGPPVVQLLQQGVLDLGSYQQLPEAAPFVEGVQSFIREYGHRGFRYELDFVAERLVDHPEHIVAAIASQSSQGQAPHQRAEAARKMGLLALRAMNPVKRSIWQRVLNWSQRLIGWREESKSYTSLHHALYGLAARHLSRRFYPDDPQPMLLFYTFDEFCAFGRSRGQQQVEREVLARRQAEYELHSSQQPPPELVWYNPETSLWRSALKQDEPAAAEQPVTRFQGIPACGGSGPVVGYALVTNDPIAAGRRLLESNVPVVLITRLTDPAWSSLFARLTAVVTELGGLISHATIVARENGLPAIVGVAEITRRVRDGQRLRVDGLTGVITVLDE